MEIPTKILPHMDDLIDCVVALLSLGALAGVHL